MIAERLLAAIDLALVRDGGKAFHELYLQKLAEDPPVFFESTGKYLGASELGKDCPRDIWLTFRWASPRRKDARDLRVFARGTFEEYRVRALLEIAGVTVWTPTELGERARIQIGHIKGVTDGACEGVPDVEGAMLLEIKTHKAEAFDKLLKVVGGGVHAAKPQHFVQMQTYMHGTGAKKCLYFAVCKNDDRLYAEIVKYDAEFAAQYLQRGDAIVHLPTVPEKKFTPSYFWCKSFCDHRTVCHEHTDTVRSCRTCAYAAVTADGWHCETHDRDLTFEQQKRGCKDYIQIGIDIPF